MWLRVFDMSDAKNEIQSYVRSRTWLFELFGKICFVAGLTIPIVALVGLCCGAEALVFVSSMFLAPFLVTLSTLALSYADSVTHCGERYGTMKTVTECMSNTQFFPEELASGIAWKSLFPFARRQHDRPPKNTDS